MSTDTTSNKIPMANAAEDTETGAALLTILPMATSTTSDEISKTKHLTELEGQVAHDSLAGLRSFLDDWEAHGDRGKGRRKETSKEDQENVKKQIYSRYMKHAEAEDEEVVKRWTETLNILLTFAGLQSAIVVAFIIFQSPKLEPDPQDSPTYVLQQILHHLNNSTTLPVDPTIDWAAPNTVVRLLAWWYLSLGCSLLSAFGALLSKQWVMHYQSQPAWANSDARRVELREMRYQGLISWWFFAVIESLPVLLQLSLLFFAIGLIEYLKVVSSPLFIIAAMLLGIGAVFYIVTLVSGAFIPFCPYQSPASDLLFRAASLIFMFTLVPALGMLFVVLTFVSEGRSAAKDIMSGVVGVWRTARILPVGQALSKNIGEFSLVVEDSSGAAGIFCWWLSEDNEAVVAGGRPEIKMVAVADTVVGFPIKRIVGWFRQAGSFAFWVDDVEEALDATSRVQTNDPTKPPTSPLDTFELADVLFHLMQYSPFADEVASLRWWENIKVRNPGEVCNSIRNAWTNERAAEPIPTLTMRWTTVAVYVRYQLLDWCSGEDKEDNRAKIIQELPTLLGDPRLLENAADVANVVSLAAIALVDDNVTGICKRQKLAPKGISNYERLFLALHRLSFHGSPSVPPSNAAAQGTSTQGNSSQSIDVILALVIKASLAPIRKMVYKPEKHRTLLHPSGELVKYPSLENGQLAETLLRLLGLGVHYRERAALSSPSERSPDRRGSEGSRGEEIITNVHAIIDVLLEQWAEIPESYPRGLSPLSSPEALAHVFARYTSEDRVASSAGGSLTLLGKALGLRYYRPHSNSRLSWHRQPSVSLQPHITLPVSLLKDNLRILPQLIDDVRNRYLHDKRLLLSVIVKGRDLFFMPDLDNKYSDLFHELTSYAEAMLQSGSFLDLSSDVRSLLDDFQRWDELVQTLTSFMGALAKQTAEGEKAAGPPVAEEQASGEIQALASISVPMTTVASPVL